ncbi:CASP-like protein 5B2 [Magnolia sinica]|uniref:CASP-like protein 5B2 n=1 Tax=Magnolia sinica TaxID=86752 RepID=UPI0026597F64|nr:CASP-like protein 5B2 [Magnolia sinica]
MKDFPGTPGTFTGLFLRVLQFSFAAASIGSMATANRFANYTAFCYLIASMGLQVVWCLGLACLDAYALARKKILRNPILISLFVMGDWITATLSLAAACASAGIVVLYDRDLGYCNLLECQNFQISVFLAFMSWALIEISSLIMFWILASV